MARAGPPTRVQLSPKPSYRYTAPKSGVSLYTDSAVTANIAPGSPIDHQPLPPGPPDGDGPLRRHQVICSYTSDPGSPYDLKQPESAAVDLAHHAAHRTADLGPEVRGTVLAPEAFPVRCDCADRREARGV